jgi:NAD(P)-dependent dehydrogenase (short-subunit alcohol dehydrogenase family)
MKPGKIDFDLNGKVALVTGSSRGIGKATALALAEYGADVAVNCIQGVKQAEDVASSIRRLGRKATVAKGDVSNAEEVDHIVKKATNQLGSVDILVNNAGVASSCWLHEMSLEEWKHIIDTDLTSVFLVTRQVLPSMIERQYGRIINISSVAAQNFRMNMGLVHYSAAKGGVISFTRALAYEVAQYDITVNSIAPGTVLTEIAAQRGAEWRTRRNAEVPLNRGADPKEIAMTVVMLASAAGGFYTGQVLCPNGGESM